MSTRELWIGTYPVAGAGTPVGLGEGVWSVPLDESSGVLGEPHQVATVASPSFLAAPAGGARRRLFAALEDADGEVAVLSDGAAQTVPSGGAYPCHLVATERALLVANYGSGTLGVLPLDDEGWFATDEPTVLGHAGSGPVVDRQEGPHAHFVAVAPGGRHVLVVDLGTDEIRRYDWDGVTATPAGVAIAFPPGTGPRHLDFSADGRFAYVAGELDVAVHVLAWDAASATGELVQSVPAVVGAGRGSDERARLHQGDDAIRHGAGDLTSHLVLAGDEVLVTVRGADVLTRWSVGLDGHLTEGRSQPLRGHWPRHFAVVGPWVVVALERADALVVLDADGTEVSRATVPAPTCVLPA